MEVFDITKDMLNVTVMWKGLGNNYMKSLESWKKLWPKAWHESRKLNERGKSLLLHGAWSIHPCGKYPILCLCWFFPRTLLLYQTVHESDSARLCVCACTSSHASLYESKMPTYMFKKLIIMVNKNPFWRV